MRVKLFSHVGVKADAKERLLQAVAQGTVQRAPLTTGDVPISFDSAANWCAFVSATAVCILTKIGLPAQRSLGTFETRATVDAGLYWLYPTFSLKVGRGNTLCAQLGRCSRQHRVGPDVHRYQCKISATAVGCGRCTDLLVSFYCSDL